eukprot:6181200-Pleurochrysis_carterae.AAC.2
MAASAQKEPHCSSLSASDPSSSRAAVLSPILHRRALDSTAGGAFPTPHRCPRLLVSANKCQSQADPVGPLAQAAGAITCQTMASRFRTHTFDR